MTAATSPGAASPPRLPIPALEAAAPRIEAGHVVTPVIAAVALLVMVVLVATNYATILNVPSGSSESWLWPATLTVPAVVGLARGWYLQQHRPDIYVAIVHHKPPTTTASDSHQPDLGTPDPFWRRVEL